MVSMLGNGLKCINAELQENWEAKLVPNEGRIYYVDHKTESSSWLPPRENWDPGNSNMPYGWEEGIDKNNKPYFINHVENYTTREDPRDDPDYIEPPKPRDIELIRDAQKGFGFVAGSEKPVVVRFVTEGGPSVDKLLPGDQLIKINGQDVRKAPREYVIDLVRSCKQSISLTVCQPYNDNSARKSALLTAAKKDKLKKNPSRVRFAEEIIVNGASVPSASPEESYVPFMPNVLKVFLENGQTKSFKYDNKTTVKDVVNSLQEKLNLKCVQHFNLVLHNMKSHMPGRMTLLQEHETVSEIATRPGARHFRCLFRVVYVPRDSYDLLKQDPVAFEYFYMQCVNDVIQERFASELKAETILRLAALHIQQHAMSNNVTGKINIKAIEKECGFEKFVPPSVRDNMRVKDLRKVLSQSMKLNQNLTAPGQKQLTALQAKLHYMKIVSELKTFGSRVFMVTLLDKKTEAMVLVGPKAGISLVTNIRFYTLSMLADFSEVQSIKVAKEKENMNRVELTIKGEEPGTLNLGLLKEDATNFVSMVNGYYRIFVDPNKTLLQRNAGKQSDDPDIPPYEGKHKVFTAPWSYPEDLVSMVIGEENGNHGIPDNERIVDLTRGPPAYEGNKEYISRLKEDLGIKSEASDKKGKKQHNGKDLTPPPTKKQALSSDSAAGKVSMDVKSDSSFIQDTKTDFSVRKDTGQSPRNSSVKTESPVRGDSKSVNSNSPESKNPPTTPIKTVIMVDSHKLTKQDHVISDSLTNQQQVVSNSLTNQKDEKHETDSIASSSSTGTSQMSDPEEGMEDSPVIDKTVRKRTIRSPTPPPSRNRKLEMEKQLRAEEIVEYENLKGIYKKIDNNENSDTDSGVGGEADKQIVIVHNSIPERSSSVDESDDGEGWETADDTGVELSANSGSGTGLSRFTDLHLDLSSITNSQFGTVTLEQMSPGSTTSPDPESTSFCPFDEDQLPQELAEAMYDPRMFFNKEVYFDPDIIDLTLLPPYPPTKEEIEELQSQARMSPMPPSPRSPRTDTPKHSPLSKTASILEDHSMHPLLQKSMSVGYTPDFLDSDIDAIIDKLTLQPPPSDDHVNESEGVSQTLDSDKEGIAGISDKLGQSWNGPMDQNGLDFENPELSHTVDLGMLALDEQYSSLVIPPPPDESETIDEIQIVPPVESVKERRKKFENGNARASEMSHILKMNLKSINSGKTRTEDNKSVKHVSNNESDSNTKTSVPQSESSGFKSKRIKLKDSKVMGMLKDSGASDKASSDVNKTKTESEAATVDKTVSPDKTESPASVSEKLNELLKSLSVYEHDEEEPGHFRRTSSLRLGRCSSLDFLAADAKATNKEKSALQTGSVRLKPTRTRPSLSLERPLPSAKFQIGSEPIAVSTASTGTTVTQNNSNIFSSIPRTHSYDALPQEKKLTSNDKNDSFASLKAKLQLCRDTLLNRSLRKRSGSADRAERASLDGDASERKSSLRRSGSFSQLFRRSGRSSSPSGQTSGESSTTADTQNSTSPLSSARDFKMLNTLTTPRSNFRPNTGPMQVQRNTFPVKVKERLAPKPPTPASSGEQQEAHKQKAGPLKALSSVFDRDSTTDSKTMKPAQPEKSSKKKAPEAPPLPKSSPPPLLTSESPTGTLISSKAKSPGSSSPKIPVTSTPKAPVTSTPVSTSSTTTPTPPPRRKNLATFTPKSGDGAPSVKSKDDSDLKRETSKSSVKTSPFATVGKMWRPMSMTSSASKDSEEYQTYNNFDALRDMSAGSASLSLSPTKVPNGHIASGSGDASSPQTVTTPKAKLLFSSTPVKTKEASAVDAGLVSEKSFALLKEKVSASHSNSVKQILEKVYTSEDFTEATGDVEKLLGELKQTMESLKSSRIDKKPAQFDMCKDELQRQVKQFVTDAKLLVSNATQTKQKLATNMNDSMHSLAKIFLHGQATMFMMEGVHQAQHLGSEVMRVTNAYKSTLNAAHAAVGKPLIDPHMKYLMRQATNLATLLSNLLKSLKTVEQR